MHSSDWAIHNKDAAHSLAALVARGNPVVADRGRRAAALSPPRDKRGRRVRIARRAEPVRPQPAEAAGPASRRFGYRPHRQPAEAVGRAGSFGQEDKPAPDRLAPADSIAPKRPRPTLRGRSAASRWHQRCGKPFPLPLTQARIDQRNRPRTRHIQDHRGKKMTNILTISARWNSPQFKGLAHSAERRTSRHVFLPSLNAVLATRKQSTPTGIPQ